MSGGFRSRDQPDPELWSPAATMVAYDHTSVDCREPVQGLMMGGGGAFADITTSTPIEIGVVEIQILGDG